MPKFTDEQEKAISAKGDTIVSASAGSGKTSVMIERMVRKIVDENVSLENMLAVTFTKKAAANMKDRLRTRLGKEIADIDGGEKYAGLTDEEKDALRNRLEEQYDLIPTADISTIHSFCHRLVKNYFYLLGRDGGAELITDDDSESAELCERAFDNLFSGPEGETGYYGERDKDGNLASESFSVLLKYLRSGRRDDDIKKEILEAYGEVRGIAEYRDMLENMRESYTEEGFEDVCERLKEVDNEKFDDCIKMIDRFARSKSVDENAKSFKLVEREYADTFEQIKEELEARKKEGPCDHPDKLNLPRSVSGRGQNPVRYSDPGAITTDELKKASEGYSELTKALNKKYGDIIKDRRTYEEEEAAYLKAGEVSRAFIQCLLDFDAKYSEVKKDENKLDYNDLEQLSMELLKRDDVLGDVKDRYAYLFVDEYQDINPVQDKILSAFDNGVCERFFVGDEKQAIYGFRGSDSKYFSETFESFKNGGKNALMLTKNFRSDDVVIEKVNDVFNVSMTKAVCDIEYGDGHAMTGRGTNGSGSAVVRTFDAEAKGEEEQDGIYSVQGGSKKAAKRSEAEEVFKIVDGYLDRENGGTYDPGDICVLSYKARNARGVAKELGKKYVIAGGEDGNILDDAEIRQVLDILSYIDNGEQDVPKISAMLSPLGDFTDDDLAAIRLDDDEAERLEGGAGRGRKTFRECVQNYKSRRENSKDRIYAKICAFDARCEELKEASGILSAGALIDKIMAETGLELKFSRSPDKLGTISLLAAKGEDMTLSAFLKAVSGSDVKIGMPACAATDGINVMTMHGSKGLEFPVVIICDAAASYEGENEYIRLFDKELGFAFNSYEDDTMTSNKTFLWNVIAAKKKKEDIKEKLNLFYVACTRAENRLVVMSSKADKYDEIKVKSGRNFAEIVDLNRFDVEGGKKDAAGESEAETPNEEPDAEKDRKSEEKPEYDEGALEMEDTVPYEGAENLGEKGEDTEDTKEDEFIEKFGDVFEKKYRHTYSDYPAKTTVSAAVKEDEAIAGRMYDESAEYENVKSTRADGAEASDVGTAYHKFLELCDFAIRDAAGIESEIERFFAAGKMTKSQKDILLNDLKEGDDAGPVEALKRVCEEVYSKGTPKVMRRERRFLCNLAAKTVYGDERGDREANAEREDSQDEVLVQGIIDLLVQYGDGSWRIVDYKHSTKGMDKLWETYGRQLELYRAAAAKILDVKEKDIGTTLVNINPEKKVENV